MKTFLLFVTIFIVFLLSQETIAQPELPRSLPSFTGTKSALPPPDQVTAAIRGVFLAYDEFYDGTGDHVILDEKLNIFTIVPMVFYGYPKKLWGTKVAGVIAIPIVNLTPVTNNQNAQTTSPGIGDIFFQPVWLSWVKGDLYFALGYGIHTKTGYYKKGGQNNRGKGYYTHQISVGGTYSLAMFNRWNISFQNRFELNGKIEGKDLWPGSAWTLDWGLGHNISKHWSVGLTGYFTRQLTEESGSEAAEDRRKYAYQGIGGEITFFTMQALVIQLRGFVDYGKIVNAPRKAGMIMTVQWILNK